MASEGSSSEALREDPTDTECAHVVKLLVSDLDPDATEQDVYIFFKSRNIEVVSVSAPPESGKCIVSVTKLEDVEKFCAKTRRIKKRPIKIELLPDDHEVENPDTIEVVYPQEISEGTLEAYFTGPMSGEREDEEDKSIEWIRIIEPGRCHIKFESSEDAACVFVQKSHTFLKNELTVSHVQSSPRKGDSAVTHSTKPELPSHVKPLHDKSAEMLGLITSEETTTPVDSGQITTNIIPHDVVPVENSSTIKDDVEYEKNKLIVTNIPMKTTNIFLTFYLERTLEMEKKDYSFELKENSALLTFTRQYTIEELESFCKKIASREMKGQSVSAKPCRLDDAVFVADTTDGIVLRAKEKTSIDDEYERNKLIVRNISEQVINEHEYLELYFEETLKLESAGYSFAFVKPGNSALLTFTKQYTVEELKFFCMKIASQKMQGQCASAELCRVDRTVIVANTSTDGVVPAKEKTSMNDKYERNKLIIRNIPEGVGNPYFKIFLGSALEFESEEMYSFELNKTSALLTFAEDYSIEELNAFCGIISSKPIMKGQVLVVELCRTNHTVLITEIDDALFATQDGLTMYFENKQSGGGHDQVEDVVMLGRKKAKVTFKSSQTVKSVLSKGQHAILGPKVKIVTCSPLVDVKEENDEADDPPLSSPNTEKRKNNIPSSDTGNIAEARKIKKDSAATKINLDLLIVKYLSNNRDILDGITREVQATATVVDWNKGIIELLLNADASPNDLESAVSQFHSLVSSTVCRADIQFPPEASTEALKTIANFSSNNNSGVDFSKNNCVGIAGRVNQIRDLENTVNKLCDCIVPASDQISFNHEDFVYH